MKKHLFWICGFVLLAALCLAATLFLYSGDGSTAAVMSDGELVLLLPLDEDAETEVTGPNGGRNLVVVRGGAVCVSEADCPDGLCVKQGRISGGNIPIVCLPNRLVVEIRGPEGGPDGVSG